MNPNMSPAFAAYFRATALAVCGLIPLGAALAAPGGGGNPNVLARVAVVTTPNPASVSRQPDLKFNVTYEVTISNTSNDSVNYKLSGNTIVRDSSGAAIVGQIATFKGSTGYPCTSLNPPNSTSIECPNINVDKREPQVIKITFQTPEVGARVDLNWTVSFQNGTPVAGTAQAPLTTLTDSQTSTEFFTTITTRGGVFYTGKKIYPAETIPGGVATTSDKWTTTIVVPEIPSQTTAAAIEIPVLTSCGNGYRSCFQTTLNIPGDTSSTAPRFTFPDTPLTIYLRIDSSVITSLSSFSNLKVYYQRDGETTYSEVFSCSLPVVPTLPQIGAPCIEEKTRFPLDYANPEWRGDWQVKMQARSNGRYQF